MQNILQNPLPAGEIARILSAAPARPVLPPLGVEAWRKVAANPAVAALLPPMRERAATEAGVKMPPLTDALYAEFYATGARLPFENAYFERRRRFARAAICALVESDAAAREKWLGSMREKLEAIFSETSWALPAHIGTPSGRDPRSLDIFAAETANLMGEALSLFGEALPVEFAARVRRRLRADVFENYMASHEELAWTKATNHGNAVCHQGILGAALAVEQDADFLARMLELAARYLAIFLRGFGENGGCSEGPLYWQYGFGRFAMLNEQLEARSGGALSFVEGDAHVREITKYGPRMTLAGGHFVNFADSARSAAFDPALLSYLGGRFGDETLLAHAYRAYLRLGQAGLQSDAQRSDLFHLARMLLHFPSGHESERSIEPEDFFFRDTGVLVSRGRDQQGNLWEFAAKAGSNAERHNHNDCGSYLLNIGGEPRVIEIGAPVYTRDYFGENRYEYLAARTLGHSLPIVNGREQAAGPQYAAKVLSLEQADERVEFSMELSACYPRDAHCTDLVRSFVFDKKRGLLRVKDFYEIVLRESFETSVIAEAPIEIQDRVAIIPSTRPGGRTLLVKPLAETEFSGVETHEYRDHSGTPKKVFRLIMHPADLGDPRFVGYELELAER